MPRKDRFLNGFGERPTGRAGGPGSAFPPPPAARRPTLPWSPDRSTSGMSGPPRSAAGCIAGIRAAPRQSSRPPPDSSLPMTPGSSRTQASISTMAASLAAREHVVADRHLFQVPPGDHALVDALEPAAHHDDAGSGGKLADPRLRQRRPARRSSAGAGADRRRQPRRWRRRARRRASPCRVRRRPGCRRRCGACRWRSRGCPPDRATRCPWPAPCRRGSPRAVPGTSRERG